MSRYILTIAAIFAFNMAALAADSEPLPGPTLITTKVDDDTGNLRVRVNGEPAKAIFDFMTTSRTAIITTPGIGTIEQRLSSNQICAHFQPEADTTGASDVYRCSQLYTSSGQALADHIDPMIGVGN